MSKIYSFIDDEDDLCTPERFVRKHHDTLVNIILDPYSKIIYCDLFPSGIFITKFLKNRFYRNATIYYLGKQPRYNPDNLPTKKFKSKEKLLKSLKADSTEIILL